MCVQLDCGDNDYKSGPLTKIGVDVKLYEEEGDEAGPFKTFSILLIR